MTSKIGKPLVELTDEQIKEVQTLSAVLNTSQIADYLGISHVTFKAIRDRDERVSFAYKNGKAKAIASIAGNLIGSAKKGNTAAQIFYLKTQAGWREQKEEIAESEKTININIVNPHATN